MDIQVGLKLIRWGSNIYSIITMLTCLEIQERKKKEMHAFTC